jgi:hypothetical protein
MDAADVKAFFDEVARDWDTMRLTYYDERVIEQLAARTQLTGEQTVAAGGQVPAESPSRSRAAPGANGPRPAR